MKPITASELKLRMKNGNWTVIRFAEAVGVPYQDVNRWKRSGVATDELAKVWPVIAVCGEEASPHGEECLTPECSCDCHIAHLTEVTVTRWRGLEVGSPCRARTPGGRLKVERYAFVRYVREEKQEFVEVRGPKGESRSFPPERVFDVRGKELPLGAR